MQLMDELIDAYLNSYLEHHYYIDLQTGLVILDIDELYSDEPGIDWEDDNNLDRYESIPKIDSDEGYRVMVKFAQRTESDPEDKLLDALDRSRPFRGFKDVLYELDLWDEWNAFERKLAEEELRSWIEHDELNYEELNAKFQANNPYAG